MLNGQRLSQKCADSTVNDFKTILLSAEFQNELSEMVDYAKHIKQERPLVYLFAKYLMQNTDRGVSLEEKLGNRNKADMVLDGEVVLEFKQHYEFDLIKIENEFKKFGSAEQILSKHRDKTWRVTPALLKDLGQEETDIFCWIILQRDLSEKQEEDSSIAYAKETIKFWKKADNKFGDNWVEQTMRNQIEKNFNKLSNRTIKLLSFINVPVEGRYSEEKSRYTFGFIQIERA